MPSPSTLRILLLVPDGAYNPRTGAGQRTAIFFRALKQVGLVDVVILGDRTKTGAEIFFPGAAQVHYVLCPQFSVQTRSRMAWLRYNLDRFLRVDKMYRPNPGTAQALSEIVTEDHQVVLSRYAQAFCVSGVAATDTHAVFVDIDDRDDQKFLSASQAVLGTGALGRLFKTWVVPAIRKQLEIGLQDARLLWYATPEDRLDISGPAAATLRNVPFDVPDSTRTTSATTGQNILFVGSFRHRPNQDGMRWFLQKSWADIRKAHPKTRLRIVGLGDWGSMAGEFQHLDGVDYVGTVEDISDEYAQARLVISPVMEGGGSKIKVIEACAYRRPVIVSQHSARGFGTELQNLLPTAHDAESFTSLCTQLLKDDERTDRLADQLHAVQQGTFSQTAAEMQISHTIRKHIGL